MWETWVWFLGWKDPMEEGMATHSSILAWRIPWTGEPGGLQSMGSQKNQTWQQLSRTQGLSYCSFYRHIGRESKASIICRLKSNKIVVHWCGEIFVIYFRGLDALSKKVKASTVDLPIESVSLSLQDLIGYFHPPDEHLEHEDKQNRLRALKNRQNLFQEEVSFYQHSFLSLGNTSWWGHSLSVWLSAYWDTYEQVCNCTREEENQALEESCNGFYYSLNKY